MHVRVHVCIAEGNNTRIRTVTSWVSYFMCFEIYFYNEQIKAYAIADTCITHRKATHINVVINWNGGDILDAQYVGDRLTLKSSHRNRCEDTWHLWNAPRMYILSHQAYVLNSETNFELPNLRFWQQRRWRFKSFGFSHVANRHTDTDVSKHCSAFIFNVKRFKFSCTALSSRLKRCDPSKRRSSDIEVKIE